MTVASNANVSTSLLCIIAAQCVIGVCLFAVFLVDFAVYEASYQPSPSLGFSINTESSLFQTTSTISEGGCTLKSTVPTQIFADEQGWGSGLRTLQALLLLSFFLIVMSFFTTLFLLRETDTQTFLRKFRGAGFLSLFSYIFLWCSLRPYDYADNMYGFCLSNDASFSCPANPFTEEFQIDYSGPGCHNTDGVGNVSYRSLSEILWVAFCAYILIIIGKINVRRNVLIFSSSNGGNTVTVINPNTRSNQGPIVYNNNTVSQPIYVQEQQAPQQVISQNQTAQVNGQTYQQF